MTMIGVLCLFLSGIAGFFIIGSLSLFIKESDALGKKNPAAYFFTGALVGIFFTGMFVFGVWCIQ